MIFETLGDEKNPAVLFFHAMEVTGESSIPVAENLKNKYFVIMPTSTVSSRGQKYISKEDEVRQVVVFLEKEGVTKLSLLCVSSIGVDLALAFLSRTVINVDHVFFDGDSLQGSGRLQE